VQKPEHIKQYERITAGLKGREGPDREYWEGAHDMLTWLLQPESEYFDPRLASLRKKATAPEEVHE
jgi:hypothetical protein